MTVMSKKLQELISEVIEEFAMMVMEPAEPDVQVTPEIVGWIDFTGVTRGRLSMACGMQMGSMLAATLLGLDEDEQEAAEKSADAVGEMLNVIGGHVITAMYEASDRITLSLPTVMTAEDAQENIGADNWDNEESCTVILDDQPVTFTMSIAQGEEIS